MTVRAVRPAAAARSRKSTKAAAPAACRSRATPCTACVVVCGHTKSADNTTEPVTPKLNRLSLERRRTTLKLIKNCICFTCRNLFRESRIGLQNAERQARLRAAKGDLHGCSEREDSMRVPSGFGIGVLAVTLS